MLSCAVEHWYAVDQRMNQSLLLHVVERLEGLIGKLPATIQKPILSELTPLKELFLQQRPPRFVLAGSEKIDIAKIIDMVFFPAPSFETSDEIHTWQDVNLPERGTISLLDVRGADARQIEEELKRQAGDIIIFFDDGESARGPRKIDIDNLRSCLRWSEETGGKTRVIAMASEERAGRVRTALEADTTIHEHLLDVLTSTADDGAPVQSKQLMSILAQELPNAARIEMIRISGNKQAQHEIAQVLIKSTTAICTAIGTQPIPLADMPILTTLQLVMVSGIMYISGRERSLRAATEFVGALGANLGAGMLLREGTRAILKFFPGWGNIVSGAVAGAGTYAIGRAAEVFFLEGVSLRDARRTYLKSRKRPAHPELSGPRAGKRKGSSAK
jgi:uncharacterized protein (DUF697 family)